VTDTHSRSYDTTLLRPDDGAPLARRTRLDAPARAAARPGPILVTGSHRSGSTWVGNVLALAPGVGYVHEPFNVRTRPGVCAARFATDFAYVTPANEAAYLEPLRATLSWRYALEAEAPKLRTPRDVARLARDYAYFETMRRRGARLVMKDPIALFSAEWLAARFDMPVVTVIRHPAAFVASLLAAGWYKFPFRTLLGQEALVRERLEPFRAELEAADAVRPEPLAVGMLLWRVIHHHIRLLRDAHPDWIFVRHEDLSRDPAAGFRDLYDRLGLDFTPETPGRIDALSERDRGLASFSIFGSRRRVVRDSKKNLQSWRRRLSEAQIAAIREGCADVWPAFYDADEW
jgi:hypothetical protein